MKRKTFNLLNEIKKGLNHKDIIVAGPKSTSIKKVILPLLKHQNYLMGFHEVLINKKNVNIIHTQIYLKFLDGFLGIRYFKIFSRPGRLFFINLKTITILLRRVSYGNFFLTSSKHGILSFHEALNVKTGGALLYWLI